MFGIGEKIKEIGIEQCSISEITLAELIYGANCSKNVRKNRAIIDSFIRDVKILSIFDAIEFYAQEKARLRSIGKPISDFDLLIAATAVANEMVMVAENVNEFGRVKNLEIDNWVVR